MDHEVYIEAGYMDETMEVPPAVEEQIRRSVLAALESQRAVSFSYRERRIRCVHILMNRPP